MIWTGTTLLAVVVLGAAGALVCRDRGITVSMERRWELVYKHDYISMQDSSPNATCTDWMEDGSHLSIGPVRIEWPDALMSGQRRGLLARSLRPQADRSLFQELRFTDAADTYGRLAAVAPGPQRFDAEDLQARAYAAEGRFADALRYTQGWGFTTTVFLGDPASEAQALRERGALIVRWKVWRYLQAHRTASEVPLRNSLSTWDPRFTPWPDFEKDPRAVAVAREEIRLALGELLLRQGRTEEARFVLRKIVSTRRVSMDGYERMGRLLAASPAARPHIAVEEDDCRRLARAYLARLNSTNATAVPPTREEP